MKKNKYKCEKCDHVMITGDRDQGTAPGLIGCVKCGELARSFHYLVDQSIEPEMIFICPKNPNEWKVIHDQMESEIRMKYPDKKSTKVKRMTDNMMFRVVEHVKKGGLVQLPIHIVEALESYNQKKD